MVKKLDLFKIENVTIRLTKHGKYLLTIASDTEYGSSHSVNQEDEVLMLLRWLLRAFEDDFFDKEITENAFTHALPAIFEIEKNDKIRSEALWRREEYSSKIRRARRIANAAGGEKAAKLIEELKELAGDEE